jgi:hypothetical protein
MRCSPFDEPAIVWSSIVFTRFESGAVPILHIVSKPSKQSTIGDKYIFPTGIEDSGLG